MVFSTNSSLLKMLYLEMINIVKNKHALEKLIDGCKNLCIIQTASEPENRTRNASEKSR